MTLCRASHKFVHVTFPNVKQTTFIPEHLNSRVFMENAVSFLGIHSSVINSTSANLFGVRLPFRYFRYVGNGIPKSLAAVFAFLFPRHNFRSLFKLTRPIVFYSNLLVKQK